MVLLSTYISELHDTQLSESRDDFAADLISHVELGQSHVRRAEQRLLVGHLDSYTPTTPQEECMADRRMLKDRESDEFQGIVFEAFRVDDGKPHMWPELQTRYQRGWSLVG